MHTVVIYDSKFGNTERIAQAIARGAAALGDVRVLATTEAAAGDLAAAGRPDLLLIGGPTHNRGASAGLRALVNALPATLRAVPAACFDTRYRGPGWLMGSAAGEAAKVIRKTGAELAAPPESFFIVRSGPLPLQSLEPGELERAEQWGHAVATTAAGGPQAGRAAALAG